MPPRQSRKTEPPRVVHCTNGKTKYTKQKQAMTAANQLMADGAPSTLRSYKCPDCGSWHLTKNLKVS